jgi:hypothetical protein
MLQYDHKAALFGYYTLNDISIDQGDFVGTAASGGQKPNGRGHQQSKHKSFPSQVRKGSPPEYLLFGQVIHTICIALHFVLHNISKCANAFIVLSQDYGPSNVICFPNLWQVLNKVFF